MQQNDITAVVNDACHTMTPHAKKKKVELSVKLDDNLPKARFDSDKIIHVLTNLISNAIKFTPEKGRISVSIQHQGEDLVIRVSDTGLGIPKEALPKIFDQFYQVHRPAQQIKGTGLGLSIVKKIVDIHNGRIEVESEVSKGTTFTVFLPLTAPVAEHLPVESDKLVEQTIVNN